MSLTSLTTRRADLSTRLLIKLVGTTTAESRFIKTLRNDNAISRRSFSSSSYDRRQRGLSPCLRRSSKPSSPTTIASPTLSPILADPSSGGGGGISSILTDSAAALPSSRMMTTILRRPFSSRRPPPSPSFLRPISVDLNSVEANVRLLDDVSLHFFQLLFTPEFRFFTDAVIKSGFEIRIVGGAVRELLQGVRPYDIDFSTDASVEEILHLVGEDEAKERMRIIKAGASDTYGSVKVRVDDKQDFEITGLRMDETDPPGICPWLLDSARRDFTFNAMYLKLDGTLVDYHGGERDLEAGDVVFVGNTQDRIREDAIRILRYFRFFGKVTKNLHHDCDNIRLMHKYRHTIGKLNSRRVWMELKKILRGEHVDAIFNTLHEYGILRGIGFPRTYSEYDLGRFNATCARTSGTRPHPCTLLADFFLTEVQATGFADRLSLTKDEKNMLLFLVKNRHRSRREIPEIFRRVEDFDGLKMYERRIVGDQWPPGKSRLVRDQVLELFKYQGLHLHILGNHWRSTLDTFKDWDPPTIPITLYDLIKIGISGWDHNWRDTFGRLATEWRLSNYRMTKEELLAMAKSDFETNVGKPPNHHFQRHHHHHHHHHENDKKPENAVPSQEEKDDDNNDVDEDDLLKNRPIFFSDV